MGMKIFSIIITIIRKIPILSTTFGIGSPIIRKYIATMNSAKYNAVINFDIFFMYAPPFNIS